MILLDRQIPLLDGYGGLASLQTDPDLGEVPVVLVDVPQRARGRRRRPAPRRARLPAQAVRAARVVARMPTRHQGAARRVRARNAQLERLVSTGLLTGLLNRGATADHLRALVSRSQRHGLALSVVLLDVDGIGDINAGRGHAAGDTVLETVAARVRSQLREEETPRAAGAGTRCSSSRPTRPGAKVGALVARLRGAVDAEPVVLDGRGGRDQRVGRAPRHWAGGRRRRGARAPGRARARRGPAQRMRRRARTLGPAAGARRGGLPRSGEAGPHRTIIRRGDGAAQGRRAYFSFHPAESWGAPPGRTLEQGKAGRGR